MPNYKPKILIVENENIIALDIKKTLENIGCKVLATVNSGEKAINIIENDPPDLITMNLKLNGDINGVDTASIISNNYKIPIIFISASEGKEKTLFEKIKNSVKFINKPFKKTELIDAVKKSLGKSNLTIEQYKK